MSKDKYDKSSPLKAYVWLKKKEVPFISFFIEQAFYEHHTFVVHIDSKVLEDKFLELPENNFNLLGELLGINIYHANQEDYVDSFNGIITDVKMSGKDRPGGGPDQQEIILSGYSLSILMDNGPRLEVYSDRTLTAIADYLCASELDHLLRNQVMVENNAILEFSMQYFESDWEMYRRLAIEYGEMMYFTGVELRFGNNCKQRPERTLTYDIDFCEIEVCGRLLPKRVDHYDYRADSNSRLTQSQNVPDGASRFVKTVAQRSERAFLDLRYPELPTPVGAQSQQDIDLLASAYEGRNATNMVYITGKSRTTNHARIGHTITLDLPKSMGVASTIGRYRVVKATHAFTERGEYEGTFEAVPADLKYAPAPKITRPIADSILAKVISNEDPLGQGRVQVEFPFRRSMDSNWLRVMSPDAGGSGGPGRGLIAIPEVDDQVMVGFEFGNPNKPYVMGSMFHGKVATGGGVDNHIKSFITKSGHTIEFDDAKDTLGITIKDKVGNSIHLDTKGKNIEITAPKNIILNAENIQLNAKNNVEISTGNDLLLSINNVFNTVSSYMRNTIVNSINMFSASSLFIAKETMDIQAENLNTVGTQNLFLHSDKKVHLNSKDQMEWKSSSLNLGQDPIESEAIPLEQIAMAVVEFRTKQGKAYTGEFGFDWLRIAETQTTEPAYEDIIEGGYKDGVTDLTGKEAFDKLKKEYKSIPIKSKPVPLAPWATMYFAPYLNLFSKAYSDTVRHSPKPTYEAELRVLVEIVEDIDRLEFEYNKTIFTIDKPILADKLACPKQESLGKTIKITCNVDFEVEQSICVYAYPKGCASKTKAEQDAIRTLAGKILVAPNDVAQRKEAKFVFVSVWTNIGANSKSSDAYLIDANTGKTLVMRRIEFRRVDIYNLGPIPETMVEEYRRKKKGNEITNKKSIFE